PGAEDAGRTPVVHCAPRAPVPVAGAARPVACPGRRALSRLEPAHRDAARRGRTPAPHPAPDRAGRSDRRRRAAVVGGAACAAARRPPLRSGTMNLARWVARVHPRIAVVLHDLAMVWLAWVGSNRLRYSLVPDADPVPW